MQYRVAVEKSLIQTGTILIEAESAYAAVRNVRDMIRDPKTALQTCDLRIEWGDPEYNDETFDVTGDANEARDPSALDRKLMGDDMAEKFAAIAPASEPPYEADTMNFGHRDEADPFDGLS